MESKNTNRWGLAITAVIFLAVGIGAGAWFVQQRMATSAATAPPVNAPAPLPVPEVGVPAPEAEIVVTIPAEDIPRMNLAFGEVTADAARTEIRVPGTVAADGYREVPVAPVTGGITTEVSAELGQTVKRGQRMARLFSQELADAQAALIGMDAELGVEHKRLARVQELVTLGAASREELEEVEAEHRLHMTHIEQARQRLLLLGLTQEQVDQVRAGSQVSSDVAVPAPIDGVVIDRMLNLGQVVSSGQQLFTVTDLSSVWIEGNLLENDFGTVRVGSSAVITTPAYPQRTYRGTVDYIDPRVDPQTRTSKVRVIVENKDLALRLGMYTEILFASVSGRRMPVVPAAAIQQIGPNSVVYVPDAERQDTFVQRTVTVGGEARNGVLVLDGLRAGERVVTDGSFLLRAESLRRNPR